MSMIKSLWTVVVLGALGAAGAACSPAQGPASGAPPPEAPAPSGTPSSAQLVEPAPSGSTAPVCGADGPGKRYIGHSADECARIRFACNPGEEYFSDHCGCGCAKTGAAPVP